MGPGLSVEEDSGLPVGEDSGLPVGEDSGLPVEEGPGLPVGEDSGLPVGEDSGYQQPTAQLPPEASEPENSAPSPYFLHEPWRAEVWGP